MTRPMIQSVAPSSSGVLRDDQRQIEGDKRNEIFDIVAQRPRRAAADQTFSRDVGIARAEQKGIAEFAARRNRLTQHVHHPPDDAEFEANKFAHVRSPRFGLIGKYRDDIGSPARAQRSRALIPAPHAVSVTVLHLRGDVGRLVIADGAEHGDPIEQLAADIAGFEKLMLGGFLQDSVDLLLLH